MAHYPRRDRLYSLYEQQPDGTWKRVRDTAYFLSSARKLWQNDLLAYALGRGPKRELRPVGDWRGAQSNE